MGHRATRVAQVSPIGQPELNVWCSMDGSRPCFRWVSQLYSVFNAFPLAERSKSHCSWRHGQRVFISWRRRWLADGSACFLCLLFPIGMIKKRSICLGGVTFHFIKSMAIPMTKAPGGHGENSCSLLQVAWRLAVGFAAAWDTPGGHCELQRSCCSL